MTAVKVSGCGTSDTHFPQREPAAENNPQRQSADAVSKCHTAGTNISKQLSHMHTHAHTHRPVKEYQGDPEECKK